MKDRLRKGRRGGRIDTLVARLIGTVAVVARGGTALAEVEVQAIWVHDGPDVCEDSRGFARRFVSYTALDGKVSLHLDLHFCLRDETHINRHDRDCDEDWRR